MPIKQIFISEETEKTLEEQVQEAIKQYCQEYNIEEALIRAIIKKESQNFVFAFRVDYSVLKDKKWYIDLLDIQERKNKTSYASYGLMQVLYGVAKHYGFGGDKWTLFSPYINIKYGCRHLAELKKRYKNIKDVIASYNAGNPKKLENGQYTNQSYVDEVYKEYKKLGGKL